MRTYKVKLMFDSQEIYDFWVKRLCLVRDCFNYGSKIIFEEKPVLGIKTIHARLYKESREKFKDLPS